MPTNQPPPVGDVQTVAIAYSSNDAGTFELTVGESFFTSGFELSYLIAITYLVKAIASLIKVSQSKS